MIPKHFFREPSDNRSRASSWTLLCWLLLSISTLSCGDLNSNEFEADAFSLEPDTGVDQTLPDDLGIDDMKSDLALTDGHLTDSSKPTDIDLPKPPPEPQYALDCRKYAMLIHPIFGDHMVLQRDTYVPIWGCTKPNASVRVSIAGQVQNTTADSKGFYKARIEPVPAGGPYTLTVTSTSSRTLSDIYFGDVYLCSGQSNMNMAVSGVLNATNEIADAVNYPKLRLFRVPTWGTPVPEQIFHPTTQTPAEWQVSSKTSVPAFSATCYFFGRDLHKKLSSPIGLIQSSVGGTKIEWWMSATALAKDKDFAPLLPKVAAIPPGNAGDSLKNLTLLFNGMIAPLRPYALRGVLWYQGESNASLPDQYKRLLPSMVQDWRSLFSLSQLPFLVVQLPKYSTPQTDANGKKSWAGLREAQLQTSLKHPKVGLAVTIDTGMVPTLLKECQTNKSTCLAKPGAVAADCDKAYTSCVIHPKDKQDVARRLVLTARGMIYGHALTYNGPLYKSMQVQGSSVVLTFTNIGTGLMVGTKAPLGAVKPDTATPLKGFALAGANKTFVWATATIKGSTVVLTAPGVTQPVAVRCGWGSNPPTNLYNKEGLPASPFRTDVWDTW